MRFLVATILVLGSVFTHAQYAPPAGEAGSTAVHRDTNTIVNWAKQCVVTRGWQNITDTTLGKAKAGDDNMATAKADGSVVSLGDGGVAVCTFEHPIRNGAGYDFAVFENSFDGLFLELAFVEVSSNGVDYVRFAAHSLTDTATQKGSFDLLNATQLNNLAGKYRGGYGTPFDLQELASNVLVDVNNITHVRVIDVVGSMSEAYATRDSYGNKVNDPFPTPFDAGGFDLDAIAVMYDNNPSAVADINTTTIRVFPNPVASTGILTVKAEQLQSVVLTNALGSIVAESSFHQLQLSNVATGIYYLHTTTAAGKFTTAVVVK